MVEKWLYPVARRVQTRERDFIDSFSICRRNFVTTQVPGITAETQWTASFQF